MDFNVSIWNKKQNLRSRGIFIQNILNNSHNDQRTSPPRENKAESQAYSHCKSDRTGTITVKHLQITWCASLGYTKRSRVSCDVNCPVVSRERSRLCIFLSVLYEPLRLAVAMKNGNKAHFTVVYVFLSFLSLFVKYRQNETNCFYKRGKSCWCSQSQKKKLHTEK